ncbi:centrosomal protein kizuna isoform X2 [Anolis carolinensis]|uniref:centrosomal protein kizuna isoform X2 n=1 Tax=Anolis carolinensis TaxID=28377 RepID=UPI000462D582|nr:PREDICTED: centrosomal protein kizuna isoform X2 [Anolis carolinensis]|eukprot:XP_008107301.1 PREDICTED: centrosomal protein kizuna isoform X2 [Anolis carolinensis]
MAASAGGVWNPSAAGCGDGGYEEQLRRLQADLRDRTNLKYMQLKKYLKEICERQKKSLLRNQDLLREFDSIEAHIKKFASSSESLQKLKAEYEREIKSRWRLNTKHILKSEESGDAKNQKVPEARQAGINNRTAMSRGLYHTATIFMGRQMSAVSSVEDFSAPQKSSKLTKSFSISDPHSHRQPSQNSYMTDSCVVQTNNDLQRSNKSDKIDGKTYLLMGKETPVTSNVSHADGRICCSTVESKTNNCSSNSVESKMSAELNSLLHERLSPENRTTDLKSGNFHKPVEEILTHEHSGNEQGSEQPNPLAYCSEQLVSGKEHLREKFPGLRNSPQLDTNAQEEDESSNGSTDLTVSLSNSEEEDETNPQKLQQSGQDVGYNVSLKSVSPTYNKKEKYPCSQMLRRDTSSGSSSPSPATRLCLSFEGFSHLLTFIEGSVAGTTPDCLVLYQYKTVPVAELEALISLCNETGNLKQEDLELCEALVLHQLQRLLQSTANACLLPENPFNNKSEMFNGKQNRSKLTPYFAMIWKRLSEHVLFLQKHHVLLEQEAKKMFVTLLISGKHEGDSSITPELKESLPEKYENRSVAVSHQEQDSYDSQKNGLKKEEVTSWCEDESREESLVEKIPITGLNIDGSGLKEQKSDRTSSEPSFSSPERRSSLSRFENGRKIVSTIKSKAFWGESDDSNSEIEAALRPQVHCSHNDEFDDFYD